MDGYAAEWDSETNTCTLPYILVYDITYAEIGSVTNPQSKIVDVKRYFK